MTATCKQTCDALLNLKSNIELLDLIKETKEPVMDVVEFGWMNTSALIEFALEPTKVSELDFETQHDLIRELALRLSEEFYH